MTDSTPRSQVSVGPDAQGLAPTATPTSSVHYHQVMPSGSIVHVIVAVVAWVRVHRKFLAALVPVAARIAATHTVDPITLGLFGTALAVYVIPNREVAK